MVLNTYKRLKTFKFFITIVLFLLFLSIFYLICKSVNTDIQEHVRLFLLFEKVHTLPSNPLYYIILKLFSYISSDFIFLLLCSICVLSAAVIIKIYATIKIFKLNFANAQNEKNLVFKKFNIPLKGLIYAIPICLSFLAPIVTSQNLYIGKISVNIWHNSTTIFVLPFAILLYYYSIIYLKYQKNLLLILALIILNLLIKPSFLFPYFIAFPFFLLYVFGWTKPLIKACCILGIGAGFLLLQYIFTFDLNNKLDALYYNGQKSGIAFAPLHVWNHYSKNIIIDILSSITFPLFYILLYFRHFKRDVNLKFGLALLFASIFIAMSLAETGPREFHGNFMWQLIISNYILFAVCTSKFICTLANNERIFIKDKFLLLLFCLHFFSGIYYILNIFISKSYL